MLGGPIKIQFRVVNDVHVPVLEKLRSKGTDAIVCAALMATGCTSDAWPVFASRAV